MAYFLGRDVNLAISTEQEAFGLKVTDQVLDITGTDSSALADTDAIPPRVAGLKTAETTSVAEVSTLTVNSATEADFESTGAGSNKYITLYDPDGDTYVIDFETSGGASYVQTTQAAAATASLKVTLATDEGGTGAIATEIADDINADATFSKVFTASPSGAVVTITNAQTGDATDILRGSGFEGGSPIIIVANDTQGVTADNKVSDITSLEIGTGTNDEDIVYMGQRTGLKAEIKNETSITITKKKGKTGTANSIFYYLFNEARCGIRHTAGTIDADVGTADASLALDNNQNMPTATTDGTNFGYRVFIQLKSGTEIMTIPNCCITDYSVALNSDGITEEVLTLYSNVRPTVAATSNTTISAKADF
jgi:hypothetical protein